MFESLIAFLTALNTLTPLAVIALLVFIVFLLVQAKAKNLLDIPKQLNVLENNHLSGLPELSENMRIAVDILRRMEVNQAENFAYIKARLNGNK